MSDVSPESNPSTDSSFDLIEKVKTNVAKRFLSWGASGGALALTWYFAKQGQWTLASICLGSAGGLALFGKFYKALEPDIDNLFQWLANNFSGWVKRSWWKVVPNFKSRYYQQIIYNCRDYRTQGLKTKGAFTLDLEKVFVPLKVAPESSENISSHMLRKKASARNLRIWDFLAEMPKQPSYQRIAVIAPPGAGKTTLLEHLSLMYAQHAHRRQNRKAPTLVPILLYLRTIREQISSDQPPSLAEVIEQRPDIQKLGPKGWFQNQLSQGRCLVLLDGLDEVADVSQRQKVSRWVDQQMADYPKSFFILTSRPFGYENAALKRIGTVIEVQPFNLEQMQQFIDNWYLQNELKSRLGKDDEGVRQIASTQANDLIGRIKGTPSLATMALNPLLLTMIATVHCYRGALPGRRVELYSEICDVLLGRRQDAKGIPDPFTATQKRSVLQVLALALMQNKTREFSPELGCELIRDKLRMMIGDTVSASKFLEDICNQTGLLIEHEESLYEFSHKSFQEYLAAVAIKDTRQEDVLIQNVSESWWAETIRLYVSQQDATRLIQSAQSAGSVAALTLAFECLEEALSVKPEVRQALEDQLDKGLESMDSALFQLAAEVKLYRRLNRLLRIDDNREIDTQYITCAEYQLFIDEQQKAGVDRQPDHWTTVRFPLGDAQKPVTGVRAKDAEAFCQWLSLLRTEQYRLPSRREVLEYPSLATAVGSWCTDQNLNLVEGIAIKRIQLWNLDRARAFDHFRDLARAHAHVRTLDLARVLDHSRARARRIHDSDSDYDHALNHALNHALSLALSNELDIDNVLSLALNNRAIDLDFDVDRALDRAFDLNLVLDLDSTLAQICTLSRSQIILALSQSRPKLLILASLWNLALQQYEKSRGGFQVLSFKQRQVRQETIRDFSTAQNNALSAYAFSVLLELRRKGEMPSWEGIRIVREQHSTV